MCYVAPIISAVTTTLIWRKNKKPSLWSLNLMFYGGALFGFVDHLWNGELFSIPKNFLNDMLLGIVIVASIFIFWLVLLCFRVPSQILVKVKNS